MSHVSEFIKYMEYIKILKNLQNSINTANKTSKPEDMAISVEHSKELLRLKNSIKLNLGYSEQALKFWLIANDEFIRTLTKQERQELKTAYKTFEDTLGVDELTNLHTLLKQSNYSLFIEEYMEDYITT